MRSAYQQDLAYIHDTGYGEIARGAASLIIKELRRSGYHTGTVVELGCGSGISSQLLCDAGFNVVGIDLSGSLIDLARKRVPDAEFRVNSFITADLPSCVAVTAFGEVLNYTFDAANSSAARAKVLKRVYAALAPRGLLLFDMASHARAPQRNPQRTFAEGADWAVLVEAEADADKSILTRRITTFRKHGKLYRRDFETHQLQLIHPAEITELLRCLGFTVRTIKCYGSRPLLKGVVGFLARKRESVGAH